MSRTSLNSNLHSRSDWTLDVTHPGVDADDGWQYSQSFSDPDEKWTAEKPPQLERILIGMGIVASSLGASSTRVSGPLSSISPDRAQPTWVRRRRWVRIMRRRLDIPPLPFLEPDGAMYHLDVDGSLIPYIEDVSFSSNDDEGQELGTMLPTLLSSAQDYVARARYLVGTQSLDTHSSSLSAIEARRTIAKLERATMELRQGVLGMLILYSSTDSDYYSTIGDEDAERKIQAEVLLNAYSRELERRRLSAGQDGLLIHDYS